MPPRTRLLGGVAGLRDRALARAESWVDVPYRWGGQSPLVGFDCSGFIVALFHEVGLLDQKRDLTAHGLWVEYSPKAIDRNWARVQPGCLVFWGEPTRSHVAMSAGTGLVIEAGGGDQSTVTRTDAIERDARVRLRPMDYRGEPDAYVDPFL